MAVLSRKPDPARKNSPAAVSLDRAVRIFRALGDPPRLRLLALLAHGELCVSQIAKIDDDGLSTVSQRLRVLRSAELVSRRRDGQHVLYGLAGPNVADLIATALRVAPGRDATPARHPKRRSKRP